MCKANLLLFSLIIYLSFFFYTDIRRSYFEYCIEEVTTINYA